MNEAHQFDQYSPDQQMGHDYAEYPHGEVGSAGTAAAAPDHQPQIPDASEEAGQNAMPMQGYQVMETGESMMVEPGNVSRTKSVHQCPVCDKIFVSFKGLQQHAIIHTDQKPYACDICGKSFRFKSNLFEHRSVHTGNTPHRCPICGKTCRLKGNLKKHLRTHCSSKEELELAWQPFASNRRAPAEIPQDAIIIRPNTDTTQLFTPPNRPKKRKFGLGADAKMWVEKIRRGDILPAVTIPNKMKRILDLVKMAEQGNMEMENLFIHARAIPIEQFDCPICKTPFYSRLECFEHIEQEHPNSRKQRPHFCDICLRSFNDRQQLATHQEHHKRVQAILEGNEIKISEPMIMMPVINEADENEKATGDGEDEEDGGSAGIIANDEDDDDWEHP